MTRTLVEYTETVTREEPLDLCDECNREVDEAGIEYEPTDSINDGLDRDDLNLHYCSECLQKVHDKEVDPIAVQRVKDWAGENRYGGNTLKRRIKGVHFFNNIILGGSTVAIISCSVAVSMGLLQMGGALLFLWACVSFSIALAERDRTAGLESLMDEL